MLEVTTKPGKMAEPSAEEIEDTSFTLSWSKPSGGDALITQYEVEKEKEGRKVAEGEVVKGKEELARQEKEQNKKLEESLQEREREKQRARTWGRRVRGRHREGRVPRLQPFETCNLLPQRAQLLRVDGATRLALERARLDSDHAATWPNPARSHNG